jgi:hypothetical protein
LFISYGGNLISKINENKGQIKTEFIEDFNEIDDETIVATTNFSKYIQNEMDIAKKEGRELKYDSILKRAVIRTFYIEYFKTVILSLIADLLAVFYSYFTGYIIQFI